MDGLKKICLWACFITNLLVFPFPLKSDENQTAVEKNQYGDMVLIKAEVEFLMGSDSGRIHEKPVHKVYLDSYYMDIYEVTNKQYCDFLNEKGNQLEGGDTWLDINGERCGIEMKDGKFIPKNGYDNHPVVQVTWYGAQAYARWAEKRLPTEAEWEYAARGGLVGKTYPYGDSIDSLANWFGEYAAGTKPVGSYRENNFGLYDMAGNVYEWCADFYGTDYYSHSPEKNPQGPENGDFRVLRGGSWRCHDYKLTCSYRIYSIPMNSADNIGFRCVR